MSGGFAKAPEYIPPPARLEGAPLLGGRQYTAVEVKPLPSEKRLRHASCLAVAGFVFSLLAAVLCLVSILVPWLKVEYLPS